MSEPERDKPRIDHEALPASNKLQSRNSQGLEVYARGSGRFNKGPSNPVLRKRGLIVLLMA